MTRDRFEGFLKDTIGLDAASIGSGAVDRAVRERAGACGGENLDTYWLLLNESPAERQKLIEAVVVPETWFFRDPGAFAALARLATSRPLSTARHEPLRLLSSPCSTGEEPYSMAMALLDAGVAPAQFTIDAIDISARAIEHAETGRYSKNSFRGGDQSFRARYFTGDRICDAVRAQVQFRHANLLGLPPPAGDVRYDVVFCRNLLIYFDRPTQDRAIALLGGMLAEDGLLFVGPSEGGLLIDHGLESMSWPMSFAFRARRAKERNVADARVARPVATVAERASQSRFALATGVDGVPVPLRARTDGAKVTRAVAAVAPPQAVLEAVPDAPVDPLRHAQQLADRGEAAAARAACERAIHESGPSAQAFYLLGLLNDAAGEAAAAIEQYRRAVYLDPRHHEALVHLAVLVEGAGDLVAARRFYERAKRAAARGGDA